MSEFTTISLAPCLFCHTPVAVKVVSGSLMASPIPESAMGFWVTCTTCALRGPWRSTQMQAVTAWNGAVTAHLHEEVDEQVPLSHPELTRAYVPKEILDELKSRNAKMQRENHILREEIGQLSAKVKRLQEAASAQDCGMIC
jgi:hypothetical protein